MKKYCLVLTAIFAAVIFCGCWNSDEKDFAKMMIQARDNMKKGQVKEALYFSQKALECQPNSVEAIIMTALAYESNLKNKEALETVQKAVKIAPKNYFVQYTYGRLLYKFKKNTQSIAALKEAAKLNPQKTEARELLARIATEERDYSTAFVQFRELLKTPAYQSKAVPWNEIGVFFYQVKKDNKGSLAYFYKAYGLDKTNPSIVLNVAILCDKTGRTNQAKAFYQYYLKLTSRNSSLAKKRASVEARLKKI